MKKRLLILEDGSVYEGIAFGGDRYQMGELIFQTGMSGYQEIISDLSYYGHDDLSCHGKLRNQP